MQKNLILEQMHICDFSRNHAGKTYDSDSTLDHVNSDCKNNVQNDVNAKYLSPQKILKQPKRFDN